MKKSYTTRLEEKEIKCGWKNWSILYICHKEAMFEISSAQRIYMYLLFLEALSSWTNEN